jgi:hypothetical protein
MAEFRAALDDFVAGREIPVAEKPHDKDPETVLSRVDPVAEEVWSLRVSGGNGGVRCFGCFAAQDIFVALAWAYRGDILGAAGWDQACDDCKREWGALFPEHPPFKGDSLDDYLSCNFYPTSPRRR